MFLWARWRIVAIFCFSAFTTVNGQADPSPFKAEKPQDKYRLSLKDGVKYANYAGAAASLAIMAAFYNEPISQVFFIAGGTLNALSSKVDPEKHYKSNIALGAFNLIWGAVHFVFLIGFTECENPYWYLYWAAKGAINITNVVYRAGFVKQKK